jgi:glycosyltransferase involved in cell wall biosynthesis
MGKKITINVSIVIKALNEERRIEAAIQSALVAVNMVGGEVVLADSCSTDRTVERASVYPIRIVQLRHAGERCCGVGPQLGYQHSFGEFVYILDGDMEMLPGFLPAALRFLEQNTEVAGVGGQVAEMNTTGLEYIARMERGAAHMGHGEVDRLDMGGLYRRSAVDQTGYFSDRNLHSYEELDLGVRLRKNGWKLWRIDMPAVRHHGHDVEPYTLLIKRWRSLYICGSGEMVRAAWGSGRLGLVLDCAHELKLYGSVLLVMAALCLTPFLPISIMAKAVVFVLPFLLAFLAMAWRKKSAAKAVYSLVAWMFNTAGLLRGLLRVRRQPREHVASLLLKDIVTPVHSPSGV